MNANVEQVYKVLRGYASEEINNPIANTNSSENLPSIVICYNIIL